MNRTPRKNATTTRGRPFEPGNPGRPKGSRHKVTLAIEELLQGEAEKLTRKAIDAALAGDMTALKLCLERIAPAPKDRAVQFEAPEIRSAADVPTALAAIVGAVSSATLTPSEGIALAALLDKYRAAYELEELERRVTALEEKQ